MHTGSGLIGVADKDEVMQASLDKFVENYKNTVIIDDNISLIEWANEYMKSITSNQTVCLYDCTSIMNQYKTWFHIFGNVQPFYAMKCNPSDGMMNLMATLPGICFDCAGIDEITRCLSFGITPNRIIYANPVKFMRDKQVWCGTLDCTEEVEKIHAVLGDEATKCRSVIRLWVDDSHSVVALGSKYGCHMDEIDAIFAVLKKYGMSAVGVAFHVGSGNADEMAYEKAISSAHDVFEKAKQYGFEMTLLDMGGGWSGDLGGEFYHNEILESTCGIIRNALTKYHFNDIKDLLMIAEPGRYFNHKTIHVSCAVDSVAKRGDRYIYRINEGVMGVFKDLILCELEFGIVPLENSSTVLDKTFPSTIMGPSNKDNDVIAHDVQLPLLKVGDRLIFENIGAYSLSLTTQTLRANQTYIYLIHKSSLSH